MKLIAATVLALGLMASPALGALIEGGNGPDVLYGTRHDDIIKSHHGPDLVYAKAGDDVVWSGKGGPGDRIYGQRGDDRLHNHGSGESPGYTDGGPGFDRCSGDPHDTFVSCEKIHFVQ